MKMPKLSPLPIGTKGKGFLSQIWSCLTTVRAWEVVEDWEYDLTYRTKIIIPKGFIFDGTSIPWPLWCFFSRTGILLIPALIHDFGYRYNFIWTLDTKNAAYKGYHKAGREFWDKIFYDINNNVNGMKLAATLASAAFSMLGKRSWQLTQKQEYAELQPNKTIRAAASSVEARKGNKTLIRKKTNLVTTMKLQKH